MSGRYGVPVSVTFGEPFGRYEVRAHDGYRGLNVKDLKTKRGAFDRAWRLSVDYESVVVWDTEAEGDAQHVPILTILDGEEVDA